MLRIAPQERVSKHGAAPSTDLGFTRDRNRECANRPRPTCGDAALRAAPQDEAERGWQRESRRAHSEACRAKRFQQLTDDAALGLQDFPRRVLALRTARYFFFAALAFGLGSGGGAAASAASLAMRKAFSRAVLSRVAVRLASYSAMALVASRA